VQYDRRRAAPRRSRLSAPAALLPLPCLATPARAEARAHRAGLSQCALVACWGCVQGLTAGGPRPAQRALGGRGVRGVRAPRGRAERAAQVQRGGAGRAGDEDRDGARRRRRPAHAVQRHHVRIPPGLTCAPSCSALSPAACSVLARPQPLCRLIAWLPAAPPPAWCLQRWSALPLRQCMVRKDRCAKFFVLCHLRLRRSSRGT
jgi:hypothetical protein